MPASKKTSQDLLRKIAAESSKKISKKKSAKTSSPKKTTTRKTRRKKTAKKRGSITKSKVALHPKVKALIAKVESKEPHSEKTLKKFGLSVFRELLASGCRKCKGTGINTEGNYCACIKEIEQDNFIQYCDQYYVWYYANVDYLIRGSNNEKAE